MLFACFKFVDQNTIWNLKISKLSVCNNSRWPTFVWGFISPVVISGGWESAVAAVRAEGSLAASLATLTPPRADSDSRPDSLSCCRVPLPCSGSPYARRLRTSPHYYSTTTVLLALSVHSRALRTARPWATDNRPTPLPPPHPRSTANELLRVTRGTLPCAQPPTYLSKTT